MRSVALLASLLYHIPVHADVSSHPAHATYIAEQIAILPEGSARVVRAINDDGEAVGGGRLKNTYYGLRLRRGSIEEIEGLPGSDYSIALGINNLGEIVGSANGGTAVRAFRSMRKSKPVDLGTLPGDSGSEALALNNRGEAAGYSIGPGGARAVVWSAAGTIHALPNPSGATYTKALALNDRGDVAGIAEHATGPRAIVWGGGRVEVLEALPTHGQTEALAINGRGEIVGSTGDLETNRRAAMWSEQGAIEDLGTLEGGETSRALGINDRGVVVGVSHTPIGNQAFIWTREAGMQNLNDLMASSSGFVLTQALAINARGVILAVGEEQVEHLTEEHPHDLHEVAVHVFLVRPEP